MSGAVWSALGRLLSVGSLFGANVILGRALPQADYAAYGLAFAAVVLLGMPASLGVPKVLIRTLREAIYSENRDLARRRCVAGIYLAVGGVAAVAILQWLGSYGVGEAHRWRAIREFATLTATWMALAALGMTFSHALQGFDDFLTAALVGARSGGVLTNVGFLGVVYLLAQWDSLSLRAALVAQVALHVAVFAYACFMLVIRARQHDVPLDRGALARATREGAIGWFFRESWPNLVLQLTSLGIVQIEMLVVGMFAPDSDVAIYVAIQRLLEVLVAAQSLATLVAGPFIAELYARNDLQRLEQLIRGTATLVAGPTLCILAILLLFPSQTLAWTFNESFAGGATALQITSIGAAIASFAGPNGLTMIMIGRQRELLRVSLTASLVYLIAAPLLISSFGITGAATATAVVFGAYNIAITCLIKSRIGIWTVASVSPATISAALAGLRNRRRRKVSAPTGTPPG
jgi:O-antigen/teichoic acid export membrane protein